MAEGVTGSSPNERGIAGDNDEERTYIFGDFNIKLANGHDATNFTEIKVILQKSGDNTIVKLGGKTNGLSWRGDIRATIYFKNSADGVEGSCQMPIFHAFCGVRDFSVQAGDVGGGMYDKTMTLSLDCEAPEGYLPC